MSLMPNDRQLAHEAMGLRIENHELRTRLDAALADNAALVEALIDARGAITHPDDGWKANRGAAALMRINPVLANPHPGAALLAKLAALDEYGDTANDKIRELLAERDRLRKALEDAALALESCPPALMRQSYAASAKAARAALAKEQSND